MENVKQFPVLLWVETVAEISERTGKQWCAWDGGLARIRAVSQGGPAGGGYWDMPTCLGPRITKERKGNGYVRLF